MRKKILAAVITVAALAIPAGTAASTVAATGGHAVAMGTHHYD
jgi:hypothetical protein